MAVTLIELSIVLVIIGLLVGGVLVGKDLIASAKLQKVAAEYQQYNTIMNVFRAEYDCLPGDCSHAASFGLGTDGNGDGEIFPYETHYVCEQLSKAGLVKASCIGGFPPGLGVFPGVNMLPSSYRDISVNFISYWSPAAPYTAHFPKGNYVSMMLQAPAGQYYPLDIFSQGGMLPFDASRLDQKIDDGLPMTGNLIQYNFVCADTVNNIYSMTYSTHYYCDSHYKLD